MFEDFETEETSIPEIRRKLEEASDSYYNNSVSLMSDEEFDNLKDQLFKLAPNDSFFSKVGAPVQSSDWKKEKHKIPMGSLNKVNTEEEFNTWVRQTGVKEFLLMTKLDGISLDLEYFKGKLIKAITRGDGTIGEDILSNVIQMKNVRPDIKGFTGSLRGEIVISKTDFEDLVKESVKNGDRAYKNPRNAASGIAKAFDGKYARFCTVVYYDMTGDDIEHEFTKFMIMSMEFSLGGCWHTKCKTPSEVIEFYKKFEASYREDYEYEIDGLVVAVNDIQAQKDLGFVHDNPKGKIAWKFGSIKKETVLRDVIWEVGLNRRITPVGQFDPTPIGGITVENATIHNVDIFKSLNLGKGDRVIISRRNDVIPYLEEVLEHKGKKFPIPDLCPSCGEDTEVEGKFLVCSNDGCKALYLGNLQKWVVKLEIMDISYATIEKLYSAGKIEQPSDFYTLSVSDIASLDGLGEKSAKKILDQFNSKKEIDLPTLIGGLNMSSFSNSQCEKLVKAGYDSLDKLYALTEDKLCAIPGIKEAIAKKILTGLKQKKSVVDKLLKVGIKIKAIERVEIETVSQKLAGKSFVFTGSVQKTNEKGERFTREDLQRLVVINGGENHTSVKKGTTYLVQADPSSASSKTKKAIQLGTEILSEDNFFKMIGS